MQRPERSGTPVLYIERRFLKVKKSCDRLLSYHPIRHSILLDLHNFTKWENIDKSEKEIKIIRTSVHVDWVYSTRLNCCRLVKIMSHSCKWKLFV